MRGRPGTSARLVADLFKAIPELRLEHPLTLGRSFAAVSLNLWDEARRRLVSFREFRKSERRAPA